MMMTSLHVLAELFNEVQQLSFAGSKFVEAVLFWPKDFIAFEVTHQDAEDDMFQDLAWDACDGCRVVVCRVVVFSFLKNKELSRC